MQPPLVFTDEHQDRFDRVHRMAGVGNSSQREGMWDLVKKAYAEKHRCYHTDQHIIECLEHYDAHTDKFGLSPLAFPQFTAMELAIWWHDVVYHIKAPGAVSVSNEVLSASCMYAALKRCGVVDIIVNSAYDLILATDPQCTISNELTPWIVDIDMAILGAERHRFTYYDDQVAIEYTREFSYPAYLHGRLHFLRTLLKKEHLYQTDAFRVKYEERAKLNIQLLITRLDELVQEGES